MNKNKNEQYFLDNGRKNWKTFLESKKEQIVGGKADSMSLHDIAKKHNVSLEEITKEYEMGLKVEKEHTTDEKIAQEIAKDHLVEDPQYYTKLQKAKLEEASKKKSIIRPDASRAAPEQGSPQLASQAAGPGTTSPVAMEEGIIATIKNALSPKQPRYYPPPLQLKNKPKSEETTKPTVSQKTKNTVTYKKPYVKPNKKVDTEKRELIAQLLNAFENGGLEAIGLDGQELLMNNYDNMSLDQKMRFDKANALSESYIQNFTENNFRHLKNKWKSVKK